MVTYMLCPNCYLGFYVSSRWFSWVACRCGRLSLVPSSSAAAMMDLAVPKPLTIKEALKLWEEKHPGEDPTEAREIKLNGTFPFVEKMDATLGTLTNVEKLSLSTNMVDKITGLQGLKHLKILSLGRNYIKSLSGLEHVAESLEELWISYNQIEKLKGIGTLKNLRVLYMSNNLVKDWAEFDRLKDLPKLEDLVFENNPLQQRYSSWRDWCLQGVLPRLPNLIKLEGKPTVEAKTSADEDETGSNAGRDKEYTNGEKPARDRSGAASSGIITDTEEDHDDHEQDPDIYHSGSDGGSSPKRVNETTDDEQ